MHIETEDLDGGIVKVTLAGRMDARGTSEIDGHFSAYASGKLAVIVDMSAVSFLTSIGIRTLVTTAKAVTGRGGKLVLLNPDESATRTLRMAGIDVMIPVVHSLDEAKSAVKA